MDVLLVALGSASAPCSVGDDRGEGDTVDHGGVPWNLVIRSSMSASASERRVRTETLLPFSSVFARM